MQAGNLNQRINLYQAVSSKSASGAPTQALSLIVPTWSSIEQKSSDSSEGDDRNKTANSYQLTIRYRTNLKTGDWIEWRGRFMKITGLDDSDPKQGKLIIDAEINPKSIPPVVSI